MEFLNTTRSTLYRWLHDGAIPAHKLGRQWRFSKDELIAFRDSGSARQKVQSELRELGAFLRTRDPRAKEKRAMTETATDTPESVAEAIIWDAFQQSASDIHLQPRSDGVHLLYRLKGKLQEVRVVDPQTAGAVEKAWIASSTGTDETGARRLFHKRLTETRGAQQTTSLQILYQSIDTLQGRRITLRILHEGCILDINRVCPKKEDRETLEKWLSAPRGLILFAGKTGSGKTTTLLSCLNHLARDKGRAVFSIEDPIEVQLDGVDQLQVKEKDPQSISNAFVQIYRSDLDALAVCVEGADAAKSALQMARSGHLVLMQMHAVSIEDAIKRFETWVEEPVQDVLVGVSHQELVPSDKGGRKAIYRFSEPAK
jgi:excisionase family DNA binding protein